MEMRPVDLSILTEQFEELASEVCENWESNEEPSPMLLTKAMLQLLEILGRNASNQFTPPEETLKPDEIDELGDYGIKLLQEMSAFASDLGLREISEQMEDLSFPFAVWLARRDCDIKTLEPIVNALARLANHNREPGQLMQLFVQTNEIIDAINPQITQDFESGNPMRPWRVLMINRAIIATRSHDREMMTLAFDSLVENFPNDAPQFFEEGIEQMHALNYPEHVKQLMQQYYLMHNAKHTLH